MSDTARPTLSPSPATRAESAWAGWLAALGTVVIWAFWMVGTRHAVTHHLPPAAVGLVRFAVPALVLAPITLRKGVWPKGLPLLTGVGLLGSGAPFFLVVAAGMAFAPAAEIGPLLAGAMPLFVAAIGWLAFGERFGRLRVLGFALIVLAVVAIAGCGALGAVGGAWRGHLLILTGACFWGIYTHAYRRSGLTALQAAGLVGLWSMLLLLPAGLPALAAAVREGFAREVVAQAILQGVLSGLLGIVLYGFAIDRLGPSRASALSPLVPVLAALIAVPVLGEIPGTAAMLGIAAATLGVLLASGILHPKERR